MVTKIYSSDQIKHNFILKSRFPMALLLPWQRTAAPMNDQFGMAFSRMPFHQGTVEYVERDCFSNHCDGRDMAAGQCLDDVLHLLAG